MNKHLYRLSRALVALIFVVSGLGKVAGFHATVAMAGAAGLPVPEVAIGAAALIEIGAGLALLAGWHERWASLGLIVFLIPATLVFHAAHLTDPAQGQMQNDRNAEEPGYSRGAVALRHRAGWISGTSGYRSSDWSEVSIRAVPPRFLKPLNLWGGQS
jgi:putative oxidoreductase